MPNHDNEQTLAAVFILEKDTGGDVHVVARSPEECDFVTPIIDAALEEFQRLTMNCFGGSSGRTTADSAFREVVRDLLTKDSPQPIRRPGSSGRGLKTADPEMFATFMDPLTHG